MYHDRSPAGVNDVATLGRAILPSLGHKRESEQECERKNDACHGIFPYKEYC